VLNISMRLIDVFPEDDLMAAKLAEGPISNLVKAGAVAAGVLGAGYLANQPGKAPVQPTAISQPAAARVATQPASQVDKAPAATQTAAASDEKAMKLLSLPRVSHVSDNIKTEKVLRKAAESAGIKGIELAAFLAQCNHESADFERMHERGGRSYFLKKYDPRFAPKTAARLGNTEKGDGARYYGRGFIQLTGRDNYSRAGDAIGIDLEDKPEMASRPDIAIKVAVWYWLHRVRPKVSDFSNVEEVTHAVNPKLMNIEARKQSFEDYMRMI